MQGRPGNPGRRLFVMRILCISQTQPGELEPMALALAKEHEVFVASQSKFLSAPGIRRIHLGKSPPNKYDNSYTGYLGHALSVSRNAQRSWMALAECCPPDIILACASNGVAFNLRGSFPDALIVSYPDGKLANLLPKNGELFAARRTMQEIQYAQSDLCMLRLPSDASDLTLLGSRNFHLLPLFTDFKPGIRRPQKRLAVMGGALADADIDRLLTTIAAFLGGGDDRQAVILLENNLRRYPWAERIKGLEKSIQARIGARSCLEGGVWRQELLAAAMLFCPRADRPIMQRLLEAMAVGCPMLVGLPRAFLRPGETVVELQGDWGDAIGRMWADAGLLEKIGKSARAAARDYDRDRILPGHISLLLAEWERKQRQPV